MRFRRKRRSARRGRSSRRRTSRRRGRTTRPLRVGFRL